MHLRPATRADLADIATVMSRAMMDDELSLWLMPNQREKQSLHRERCLQTTIRRWNAGYYLIVIVLDEKDPEWKGTPMIIGYAAYEREVGTADDSSRRQRTFWPTLERWLYSIEDSYYWHLRGYLGTNKSHLKLLDQELSNNEAIKKLTKFWELSLLAVDPAFGRRGIGAELIGWGKARATEDKVPLWLWASTKGYGLYSRQGFKQFAEVKYGRGFDGPAPLMMWEPETS